MGGITNKIKNYKNDHTTIETINWLFVCIKFKILKLQKKNINYNYIKTPKNESSFLYKKNNLKVLVFGNIPYYDIGGGQRSSQLAKTFNKMGYDVYYIYGYKSGEISKKKIELPLSMHNYIDKVKPLNINSLLNKDDICIFEAPSEKYNSYVDIAMNKNAKIIYENIDNWETSLGNGVFDEKTLKKLIINSNLLVGSAMQLVDQLRDYCKRYKVKKEIIYLPNAVDDEMFSPLVNYDKPVDLVKGDKTLLYYGSLWGEWFDWNIVFDIANNYPTYTINLIGEYNNILDIVNKSPKNIYYLGLKKQYELPAYLKYSDYALLPFKKGKIGNYVSPLKIFEYISMNKIVLATNLPDIKGYPNTYYGDNFKELRKFLDNDIKIDDELSKEFVSDNSWYSRATKMLEEINAINRDKCVDDFYKKISIIVLNYNNKGIIDKCIDSLIMYNSRYNYEIIVVDNNSIDGSYEQLSNKYKNKIKLVRNKKNGCSSGRNLGVTHSTRDYILFLDSDQWALHNYWIDPYFEIYKNIKNVGLIGWAAGWFNKYGKAYHVVDSFPNKSMPQNCLARCDIGYLGSGGMIVSKKIFNKIGGFDIKYDPTCYEDTDLSLKVRNIGLEIYYCPYLGVMHLPHQTTKSGSKEHTILINNKADYFVKKWKEINPDLLKYTK